MDATTSSAGDINWAALLHNNMLQYKSIMQYNKVLEALESNNNINTRTLEYGLDEPRREIYVKILYLRNLDVSETPEVFERIMLRFVAKRHLEKVFKFKNYAFVHLQTREIAENLMTTLKEYYKGTPVEVMWAKPPNKYTTQEYRQRRVSSLSVRSSPTKSTSSVNLTFSEICSAALNSALHNSSTSSEDTQKSWPELPRTTGLNNFQPILNTRRPTTYHEMPSTAAVHELPSPTSYDYSNNLLYLLTQAVKHEAQHTSTNGRDIPVTASSASSSNTPSPYEYVALGRPIPLRGQQGCNLLNPYDIAMSNFPSKPVSPVPTPSYSSLLKLTIPEQLDPIKEYQRKMQRTYDPRSEIFDIGNMRREMAIVPRDVTFQEIRHFVGDILDDYLEEDKLESPY